MMTKMTMILVKCRPAIYPGQPCSQSRQPATSTVSQQSPPTSSSNTSTIRKKKKTMTAADEAIVAISQMIEGTERMEKRVEALLTQSKSPNAAWATWMGTELEQMHLDVWDQCQDATYDVIRVWKACSNDIRWRELVQQQQGAQPAAGFT